MRRSFLISSGGDPPARRHQPETGSDDQDAVVGAPQRQLGRRRGEVAGVGDLAAEVERAHEGEGLRDRHPLGAAVALGGAEPGSRRGELRGAAAPRCWRARGGRSGAAGSRLPYRKGERRAGCRAFPQPTGALSGEALHPRRGASAAPRRGRRGRARRGRSPGRTRSRGRGASPAAPRSGSPRPPPPCRAGGRASRWPARSPWFPSASSIRETKERSIFRMSIGKRWR